MSFKLTYGILDVTLRNPDTGDVRRVTLNDIRRFTRSGDYKGVSDTDHWVQANYYAYKFSALTNVLHVPADPPTDLIVDQLKEFLILSAGLEIVWEDHFGVSREGYIITPVNEIIRERPECVYTINLEILEKPE